MTKLGLVCLCLVAFGCGEDRKTAPPQTPDLTLKHDGVGLVQTQTANGASVKLDGQYENAVLARRNADGTMSVECHDDQAEAEAFVHGTATVRAPEVQ
jgi:hypothetical protein